MEGVTSGLIVPVSSVVVVVVAVFIVIINDDNDMEGAISAAASAVDSKSSHCATELGCRKKRHFL